MTPENRTIQEVVSPKKRKKKVIVASTSLDEERWISRQRIFSLGIFVIIFMALLDVASDYNMYLEVSVRHRSPFFSSSPFSPPSPSPSLSLSLLARMPYT